jgi:hypothetical protein
MENTSSQNPEVTTVNSQIGTVNDSLFFSLLRIFYNILRHPISGAHQLFASYNQKSFVQSIVLFLITAVTFVSVSYFMVESGLRDVEPIQNNINIGFVSIVFMVTIAILSFLIKSLSGKADFKQELFTGAICGIPLTLLLVVLFVINLITSNVAQLAANPLSIVESGIFLILLVMYVMLFMINLFQQSLKVSNVSNTLRWYISPISILLSFYVSLQLFIAIA